MDKGKRPVTSIEPSRIMILLLDINVESRQEILALLCRCSYRVAAVWSPGEVFDTIEREGPRVNIILAEVNLLMSNDAHVLRYIMHKKELKHAPVTIITTRDQVSTSLKGVKLGATDYLVKPLRIDEISNLWMYSQR